MEARGYSVRPLDEEAPDGAAGQGLPPLGDLPSTSGTSTESNEDADPQATDEPEEG